MYRNSKINIIARLVCWILLLQMANISVDPPDLRQVKKSTISLKEDLSINEMESVYELISEGVFENNVPESEENDIDSKLQSIDLYCFTLTYDMRSVSYLHVRRYSSYYNNFSFETPEPNSPPPKYA
jgi:hypothetical protein